MRYKIEDREYEFDGDFTIAEGMLFYDKANIGMAELQLALQRGNPYAAMTMMYILKKRAGEAVRWEDLKHLSVTSFVFLPDIDDPDQDGKEDAENKPVGESPDPTKGDGTTPESDTTTT